MDVTGLPMFHRWILRATSCLRPQLPFHHIILSSRKQLAPTRDQQWPHVPHVPHVARMLKVPFLLVSAARKVANITFQGIPKMTSRSPSRPKPSLTSWRKQLKMHQIHTSRTLDLISSLMVATFSLNFSIMGSDLPKYRGIASFVSTWPPTDINDHGRMMVKVDSDSPCGGYKTAVQDADVWHQVLCCDFHHSKVSLFMVLPHF